MIKFLRIGPFKKKLRRATRDRSCHWSSIISGSWKGTHGFLLLFSMELWFYVHVFFISNTKQHSPEIDVILGRYWDLCQMIAPFLTQILNTFLSGRVRQMFGKFWIWLSNIWVWTEKALLTKKRVCVCVRESLSARIHTLFVL